jgi:acyl-CoA synthetase (AMP-forming)/AMP-acid ligase II
LAGARVLVTDEQINELPGGRPPPALPASAEEVAFLQPTSGTSGEPRIAVLRHENVLAYLRAIGEAHRLGEQDVFVAWVPPWHDLGLLRFVIAPVAFGAPCQIVVPSVRTIPLWLETVSAARGTVTGAPDFAYRIAARAVSPEKLDLGALRIATNGGEPVKRTTIEAFESRFGVRGVVLPGYGLAEATLGVTTHRPGESYGVDGHGNVSNGRPVPGVRVRIASERRGEAGEILVQGPTVFAGYVDEPDATRQALRDGWLHTGDSGTLDADGRLYVLGRLRAMINRGGEVIPPREIEEAALCVPEVRMAAAVGIVPDSVGSEELVVVVETDAHDAHRPAEVSGAVARAIGRQAGFTPQRVSVVPPSTIPRTLNGKVRYLALRKAVSEGRIG